MRGCEEIRKKACGKEEESDFVIMTNSRSTFTIQRG